MTELGYSIMAGETFLGFLRRAASGENPDLLFAEIWANAEHIPYLAGGQDDDE